MDELDKRLIEKLNVADQEKYFKEHKKHIPDASGKFDEVSVEHDPINLLNKLQNATAVEAASDPEPEEDTPDEAPDEQDPA